MADCAPPREEISEAEVAWVAGILEGEGCWTRKEAQPGWWWIAVRMNDGDVVRRLREYTGIGTVRVQWEAKETFSWQVGIRQHREWLTLKVWPWLGDRRRQRIRELWPSVGEAQSEEHLPSKQKKAGSNPATHSS
jgi:hypothetical protein